jgi:hypothetical protein
LEQHVSTYAASSTNGGTSWAVTRLSGASQMPNYEMFGDRRVPFHGDYNYVSSVGAFAYNTWTDTRQDAAGAWSQDTCPNDGGLDQDIYGAATTG